MVELFGVVLTSAVSWGVGKILDATLECFRCHRTSPSRIGNAQRNSLGCTNCWQEHVQFTNACDYTVAPSGRVGHVGAVFRGGWSIDHDPYNGKSHRGWAFFYTALRARDLANRQFVVAGELSDYNRRITYSTWDNIYMPNGSDSRWYENERLPLRWDTVPDEDRDSRIFAVDLTIRSRYRDELFNERLLVQLWKN